MTLDNPGEPFGDWLEPFETIVDSFGLSANTAINNAIHSEEARAELPADFPPALYALALALGAVAGGAQKAAEFTTALEPYGFADDDEMLKLLCATVMEHFTRKRQNPDPKPN